MSADVVRDVMDIIAEKGFGEVSKNIYSPQIRDTRNPPHGILVEQRNTAPVPDIMVGCDTLYVNIQVRGPGGGESARAMASQTAYEIYRALNLVMDIEVNGTHYVRISPDSAPYEVIDGSYHDYLFGLEIVRYYQEDVE